MSDLVGDGIKYSSSAKSVVVTVTGCGTDLTKVTVGIQVSGKKFWGKYTRPTASMLVSQADFTAYRTRVDQNTEFPLTLHRASDNTTILSYTYDNNVTIPSKTWSLAISSE